MSNIISIPTRKIRWKSSVSQKNSRELLNLQHSLYDFYKHSNSYYENIDFTSDVWNNRAQLEIQDILFEVQGHNNVLEVGCGRANILKSRKINPANYTGLDFSPNLISQNRKDYPNATFYCITDISRFPVYTEHYDLVFSHFVLEHCVFPIKFLDECFRVLQKKGTLCILCPDFLGVGKMSSQRSGFSEGTGRKKIKSGKLLDAIVTGFDNKIKIPAYCYFYRLVANASPKFFINLQPTCFVDEFKPDVDAVYLTYINEIKKYLESKIKWSILSDEIRIFSKNHAHIYLKGIKIDPTE
jgi:SAM-dependent methyltransferase